MTTPRVTEILTPAQQHAAQRCQTIASMSPYRIRCEQIARMDRRIAR